MGFVELALVRRICHEHGLRCAVSDHWRYGGAGAEELARAVRTSGGMCESTYRKYLSDYTAERNYETLEAIYRQILGGL